MENDPIPILELLLDLTVTEFNTRGLNGLGYTYGYTPKLFVQRMEPHLRAHYPRLDRADQELVPRIFFNVAYPYFTAYAQRHRFFSIDTAARAELHSQLLEDERFYREVEARNARTPEEPQLRAA